MNSEDLIKISNLFNNCESKISPENLEFFVLTIAQKILRDKRIHAYVGTGELEKGNIATCYVGNSISKQNGKIAEKRRTSYAIYFDMEKLKSQYSGLSCIENESIPKLIDIVHTIAHEIEHAVQNESFDKQPFSNNSLIMAKENLCGAYGFGQLYWDKLLSESDAEIKGWETTINILHQLAPNMLLKYGNQINITISEIQRKQKEATITLNVDGQLKTMKSRFASTIGATSLMSSNLEYYLIAYPILNVVYNQNGSKKTYEQLLSEMSQQLSNVNGEDLNSNIKRKNIVQLYKDIFNSDVDLIEQKRLSEDSQRIEMQNFQNKVPIKPEKKQFLNQGIYEINYEQEEDQEMTL